MVTKVMETAPPTRKLYLPRPRPMKLDIKDEAASRIVAENAVCVREGRSKPQARAHLDCAGAVSWLEGIAFT